HPPRGDQPRLHRPDRAHPLHRVPLPQHHDGHRKGHLHLGRPPDGARQQLAVLQRHHHPRSGVDQGDRGDEGAGRHAGRGLSGRGATNAHGVSAGPDHHHTSEGGEATVKRRSFIKGAVLTTAAAASGAPFILTTRKSGAQTVPPVIPPSPPTNPWQEDLPAAITPLPQAVLSPAPSVTANIAGGEIGRAEHQRYAELTAPDKAGTPLLYE